MTTRVCSNCHEDLPKLNYSKNQWAKKLNKAKCKSCVVIAAANNNNSSASTPTTSAPPTTTTTTVVEEEVDKRQIDSVALTVAVAVEEEVLPTTSTTTAAVEGDPPFVVETEQTVITPAEFQVAVDTPLESSSDSNIKIAEEDEAVNMASE